jgi:hypothetical protein|tara:strand:+ start:48 stop:470 length:423 start_codon:yes stop_codon:yes gene_type:complete
MTYKIGQLLFIVSNSTKTIEPIQVTSKQTLEDLAGTTIQHMCCGVSGKTFTLEAHIEDQKLAGVFESVEEAESHLLVLATDMVKRLSNDAREKSSFFKRTSNAKSPLSEDGDPLENVKDGQTIILEDGTQARIHLPGEIL